MLALRFLEILFFGFLCGLIPGPVVTAVFTDTIRRGWKSARRIVLWAAFGELVMSVICVAVLTRLSPTSVVFPILSLFGALLLLNLSWDLWKVEEIPEEEPLFSNQRIFFLALLNGMAWVFWITVCAPQAVSLGERLPGGAWLFIVFFEIGWLISTFLLCYLFGFFRPYFQSNRKLHLLYRLIAVIFVGFALKLAIGSARALLQ
jgi:threonine/homoserine/homoserine lactone efflux protein